MPGIKPYTPDLEAWRDHFKNIKQDAKFHLLKPRQKTVSEEKPVEYKLVAPTQQTVERAKVLTKKRKKAF